MAQGDWIELSGLWAKQNQKGKFMTGTLNGYTLMILPNKYKENDNHPDFRLLLATKKEQRQQQRPQQRQRPQQQRPPADDFGQETFTEEDIPF